MCGEMLYRQAEDRTLRLSGASKGQVSSQTPVESFEEAARFPISRIKDFLQFNSDLSDKQYSNRVVSTQTLQFGTCTFICLFKS